MNQEYCDDILKILEDMSDDEFLEALEEAGLSRCPFTVEESEEE